MIALLTRFLFCFLAGSIPFAVVSMIGSGVDIRRVGSGNPGFNNVLRVSKGRAVLALLGDMGKGYLSVWLVMRAWPIHGSLPGAAGWLESGVGLGWLYGLAAVLGHCFSPFLGFNGGKGIATSGGVMLVLYPGWAAIALVYFTLARVSGGRLKWREAGTIASLTTWALFTLMVLVFVGGLDALCAALMSLFLTWRHKKNLRNLASVPAESKAVVSDP